MKKKWLLLIISFLTISKTTLYAQKDSLEALVNNPEYQFKKKLYVGLSVPILISSREGFKDLQYGAQATVEWFFSESTALTSGVSLLGWKKDDLSALVLGLNLGIRYYAFGAENYFYIEPRLGTKAHFKVWEDQNHMELNLGFLFGLSIPLNDRIKIDIFGGGNHFLLRQFKTTDTNENHSPSKFMWETGIGINFSI